MKTGIVHGRTRLALWASLLRDFVLAVAALALGIGGVTGVFSVLNAVLILGTSTSLVMKDWNLPNGESGAGFAPGCMQRYSTPKCCQLTQSS